MSEIGSALLVFALLLVGTALGVWVRPLLPEEHKAHETVQLIQIGYRHAGDVCRFGARADDGVREIEFRCRIE